MDPPRVTEGLRHHRLPDARRWLGAIVGLLLVLGVAAACDDGGQVITGIVIDVQQSGPADVTGFTLRADDGRLMAFKLGGSTDASSTFPSIHLRDHMASAQRVAVRYVATDAGPVAIRLADAP